MLGPGPPGDSTAPGVNITPPEPFVCLKHHLVCSAWRRWTGDFTVVYNSGALKGSERAGSDLR